MDPISIIGTAGAAANIMEVLSKTIRTCYDIYHRWKDADATLTNLIAQMTGLKAALFLIQEWSDAEQTDHHHLLAMDLDVCLTCCRNLVTQVDQHISDIQIRADGSLATSGKANFLAKAARIDELQKSIERQTSAFTLLLAACNSKSLSEQRALLSRKRVRKTISKVQNDSISLIGLRDGDSFRTQATDAGSKLSLTFSFDRELLLTQVYERVIRLSVKNAIRSRFSMPMPDANKLVEVPQSGLPLFKILVLGISESGKSTVIKQTKSLFHNGYTEEERRLYRPTIYRNLHNSAMHLIFALEQLDIKLENPENKTHCQKIMSYEYECDVNRQWFPPMDAQIGVAIASLWSDPCMPKLLDRRNEFYLIDAASYFLDNVERLAAFEYIPSEADVWRARTESRGIYETTVQVEQASLRLFDVGGTRSERKKWIHVFEGVDAIIFTVDLACYDQVLLEDSAQNRMTESLDLFDSVVNSRWFAQTKFFLLLNKVDAFRDKLAKSPLESHCTDYHQGNDVNEAVKYLLWRFDHLKPAHINLYPHLTRTLDSEDMRLVFSAIEETLIQNALKGKVESKQIEGNNPHSTWEYFHRSKEQSRGRSAF